jgi:hypothetical protein
VSPTEGSWTPPGGLKNHGGGNLSANADFFVAPPPEIGSVTSAYTTLRTDKKPKSVGTRLLLAIVFAGLGAILGLSIDLFAQVRDPGWQVIWPVGLGGLALVIAFAATGFKHTCTFVGQEGMAKFICSGNRDRLTTSDIFRFRDAAALRTGQVRRFVNGVYQGTNYTFTWSDTPGRKCYAVSGTYQSKEGNPHSADAYHYANAGEIAWSLYLLHQSLATVNASGSIYFGLTGGDWIRLGQGYMKMHFRGQQEDCTRNEISHMSLQQGTVVIKRIDAKEGWFSSKGVYKFPYSSLSNARLFLLLMEKLVGVPIR